MDADATEPLPPPQAMVASFHVMYRVILCEIGRFYAAIALMVPEATE